MAEVARTRRLRATALLAVARREVGLVGCALGALEDAELQHLAEDLGILAAYVRQEQAERRGCRKGPTT